MKRSNRRIGTLLNDSYRESGEATINGKFVKWDGGYCITFVLHEETQSRKMLVDPSVADTIEKKLANVRWGAIISFTVRGKFITELAIEADPISELDDDE